MKHTGKLDDEVFVGNVEIGRDLSYLIGVDFRLGDQPLDIHGKQISPDYMRPLFVKRHSAARYDRIMMDRMSARNEG